MQEKNLNLIPSGDMPVIYASQYDKNRVIRFNLFEGEDEYTLSGTEIVKCNIRKNDEHIVIITPVIGANKYIDIYLTEQACACFGDNIGEITISDDADTLIGTINFILKVERNPIQGGVTSASDIADLETQIEEIVHEVMTDDYYTRDEVDAKLDLKANSADVYTKAEVDTALSSKANTADVYTKTQVDTALGLKADKSDTYTKTQVDTALALKADSSSVYTKAEVDTALALKANAADVYTKTEVDEMIEELYPVNSASGSIANFTTSLALPLVACKAQIVAQQAGSGTPSPQNVRSISGVSSAVFQQTGKNLIDVEGQTITSQTTVLSNFLLKKGTYTLSVNLANNSNIECRFKLVKANTNVELIILKILGNQTARVSGTVTLSEDTYCSIVCNGASAGYSFSFSDVLLQVGSTATSYEPYNLNDTFTIQLGQTVYGGVLDVKNGSATIEMGIITYDGSEDWQQTAGGSYYINNSDMKSGVNMSGVSNMFAVGQNTTLGTVRLGNAIGNTPNQRIYFVDNNTLYADLNAWKTFLASNNLQICYPLATPIEITGLTPANFTTFAGENNIFADCGDISVSFKQGIQEYIDDKLGG